MQFWSCKPILACFWGSLICMKWKCLRALSDSWGPILALSEACGYINFSRKNNLKTFHTWEVGHSWIYARIYCVESEGYMLDGRGVKLVSPAQWRVKKEWFVNFGKGNFCLISAFNGNRKLLYMISHWNDTFHINPYLQLFTMLDILSMLAEREAE